MPKDYANETFPYAIVTFAGMDKRGKYDLLLEQMQSLYVPNIPAEGNLSNILALLKSELNLFWCGLYMRTDSETLGLGCFQGLPACTIIKWGRGVCGTAASTGKTQIVDDVMKFPGYIACHSETASEIVVPGIINGRVEFVLDVDSAEKAFFDDIDRLYLEKVADFFADIINKNQ